MSAGHAGVAVQVEIESLSEYGFLTIATWSLLALSILQRPYRPGSFFNCFFLNCFNCVASVR